MTKGPKKQKLSAKAKLDKKIKRLQCAELIIRFSIPLVTFIISILNFIATDVVTSPETKKKIMLCVSLIGISTSVPLALSLEVVRNVISDSKQTERDLEIDEDQNCCFPGFDIYGHMPFQSPFQGSPQPEHEPPPLESPLQPSEISQEETSPPVIVHSQRPVIKKDIYDTLKLLIPYRTVYN